MNRWRLLFLCLLFSLLPGSALAWSWQDLWKTPAQQLLESEAKGDYETLMESESSAWQGAGRYRSEDYAGAAESYSQSGTVTDHYNRGTALTRAGDYDAAIKAFDDVLATEPDHANASHNRAIAEQLKALQQQQQENGEESGDQDSQQQESESGESESDSGESNQDQQNQQEQQQQQQQSGEESASQEQQSEDSEQQQSESEEQQAQAAEQEEQQQQEQQQQESETAEAQEPLSEDQQATEQWLRRIPDDPTGLLRRKLLRNHQTEYPGIRNSKSPW